MRGSTLQFRCRVLGRRKNLALLEVQVGLGVHLGQVDLLGRVGQQGQARQLHQLGQGNQGDPFCQSCQGGLGVLVCHFCRGYQLVLEDHQHQGGLQDRGCP